MKVSGGPTQDEIMAISLQKLRLKEGDIMVDVGCGTGKVSIEASKTCSRVYALDLREEAIGATRENIEESGARNIFVVQGKADELIPTLGGLDAAFVGGSRDLENVLRLLAGQVNGRIVVNAVLLQTLQCAVKVMQELNIFEEVVHVSIARSYPLANSYMLRPIDPVYIIVGRCN